MHAGEGIGRSMAVRACQQCTHGLIHLVWKSINKSANRDEPFGKPMTFTSLAHHIGDGRQTTNAGPARGLDGRNRQRVARIATSAPLSASAAAGVRGGRGRGSAKSSHEPKGGQRQQRCSRMLSQASGDIRVIGQPQGVDRQGA